MNTVEELKKTIRSIMKSQLFGVLTTLGESCPHSTIITFYAADDLKSIVFFTSRNTRKFENLLREKKVSLFVDNRTNRLVDLQKTYGIEVKGEARETTPEERQRYIKLFLTKYQEMVDFTQSPGNAMIKIDVRSFDIVHNFQDVTILEVADKKG